MRVSSMSFSHPISPPLSRPPLPVKYYPSFPYENPQPPPLSHGCSTIFAFCHYRRRQRLRPVPLTKGQHGFSWLSSCRSFRGVSGAEFGGGSEEEEEEVEEVVSNSYEEEVEVGAEENWTFGSSLLPDRWDVLGLGQAMVDLSNSLVALARLGSRPIGGPALNVAMVGSVGSDPLGSFYRAKLRRANVHFLSEPIKDGTTGTVIVLTTPDAHRTMLSYQGTSSTVNYNPSLASIISKTNILVVEGYLFELPDTIKTMTKACEEARRCGALVAVTASDVSCIERHYDDFWEMVGNHADIVFANSDEARALCHFASKESPISAARYLSHFVPLVSVTDGPRGSYIGVKGEAVYIPPSPCVPVDTCGAGDAYASGILYGILRGMSDLKGMGTLATRIAATVVGQQGTRLRVQDAVELAESFSFHYDNRTSRSDVSSDHISSF
ncbi:hypothetical protein CJ030_MR7G004195 [Morella rubra]|uniref:Carbohydrate kinase PfkB domain-containing protein n=1 Tax=Morella rubra TaxID=262757 RepID=A0A6A1UXC0_9ROSI|nr:hypothetical protein CJ030_MR7G004195 [Morella rubra]